MDDDTIDPMDVETEGEGTATDNAGVSTKRVRKVLVGSNINVDTTNNTISSVSFFANSEQRGDTNLQDGSQGDHTIAYTEVLLALLNSADGKGIAIAKDDVRDFINSILGSNGRTELEVFEYQEAISREHRKLPSSMIREYRGEISRALYSPKFSAQSDFLEYLASMTHLSLKYYKIDTISKYMREIANVFLTKIQEDRLTTFHSKGRVKVSGSEESKGAGAEKSSSRALVALDMLCSMCSSDISSEAGEHEFEMKMAKFEKSLKTRGTEETEDEHAARYGLTVLFGERGTNAGKTANYLLRNLKDKTIEQKKAFLDKFLSSMVLSDASSSSRIAGFIGGLLDYSRQIRFDLSKTTLEDVKKNFLEKDGNVIKEENVAVEGTKKAVATVTRTSEEDLIEVLSRSMKMFLAAFPNLRRNLEQPLAEDPRRTKLDDVLELFLRLEVLERQGWGEHVLEPDSFVKKEAPENGLEKKVLKPDEAAHTEVVGRKLGDSDNPESFNRLVARIKENVSYQSTFTPAEGQRVVSPDVAVSFDHNRVKDYLLSLRTTEQESHDRNSAKDDPLPPPNLNGPISETVLRTAGAASKTYNAEVSNPRHNSSVGGAVVARSSTFATHTPVSGWTRRSPIAGGSAVPRGRGRSPSKQ